jgi:hypothetical protein
MSAFEACRTIVMVDLMLMLVWGMFVAVHKRDIARAEDALMVPYGTEIVGMQRDWNEELQSCREFSRESLQDR